MRGHMELAEDGASLVLLPSPSYLTSKLEHPNSIAISYT